MVRSAGILVFRRTVGGPEFLLGHHGGPFWAGKDEAGWTIPKGLIEPDETPEAAARREFLEETGLEPPVGLAPLTVIRTSGKQLHIWLAEADLDLAAFSSNPFEMEWPRRSGRMVEFPELDRISYWAPETARRLIVRGQQPVLEEAVGRLDTGR